MHLAGIACRQEWRNEKLPSGWNSVSSSGLRLEQSMEPTTTGSNEHHREYEHKHRVIGDD
ncbi:unknown protein [Paenibacillus amylolyticus]|uniref:Uncharacterized protein n=1 Tax=Paenibacillus amylolyticus TaxID=1451 RepID=A0A124DYF0_PAEAM|nr:unknown protein [Paenibacillus amylolyticus]